MAIVKLFKITNPVLGKQYTFQHAVVIAENEAEAQLIHPGGYFWAGTGWIRLSGLSCLAPKEEKTEILKDSIKGSLSIPTPNPPAWGWKDEVGRNWVALSERESGWPSNPNTVVVKLLGKSTQSKCESVVVCDLLETP